MDERTSPDAFLESLRAERPAVPDASARLGQIVAGSLSKGLEIKLDPDRRLEELAVGRYVVMRTPGRLFFGMITDVALDSTNPGLEKNPPDISHPYLKEIYLGHSVFGRLHVSPLLVLDEDDITAGKPLPRPVKTIPGHYTTVETASPEEVAYVFGEEGSLKDEAGQLVHYFRIGTPLDMENVDITLNLNRLVERSSAVFGKSGTGKTFLSRLLLAGVIQHDVAVNLIFDMHNEYGWEGSAEHGVSKKVKGLKQLFPHKVTIFTLDPDSSRRRGSKTDLDVKISFDQIEPEDVEMLAGVMNLSEPQIGAMYALHQRLGKRWLGIFLSDEELDSQFEGLKGLADEINHPQQSLAALHRKLARLQRFGFISREQVDDSVNRILDTLQRRHHVVLEFGRYGNDLRAYLLIANYLTRRIHKRYVDMKEKSFGQGGGEPTPLVITIEEAHKFLDPKVAAETIFGTIARELRKYNVTLLIVDQRPSGIDPEVMSQIGTRVTLALDSEEDIRSVFMGVRGASELRQVLAGLDTKEQALILGHAVPMPVVVQTRRYDTTFYQEVGFADDDAVQRKLEQNIADLGGKRPKHLT